MDSAGIGNNGSKLPRVAQTGRLGFVVICKNLRQQEGQEGRRDSSGQAGGRGKAGSHWGVPSLVFHQVMYSKPEVETDFRLIITRPTENCKQTLLASGCNLD